MQREDWKLRGNLGGINREYSGYEINFKQKGKRFGGIRLGIDCDYVSNKVRVVQESSSVKQKGSIGG